jgi:hypothetical protein
MRRLEGSFRLAAMATAAVGLAAVMLAPLPAAAAPPAVAQLGADLGLDADAIRDVTAGKMVPFGGKESSERDLGAGFAFFIKAPPAEVARQFRAASDLGSDPNVVASHKLGDSAADLDALHLQPRGADEAKRNGGARPGDTLNHSADEIAAFSKLGAGAATADVEKELRKALWARYQAYKKGGLAAIAPYARADGKERKVADELRGVTELAAPMLQKYAPTFQKALAAYPHSRPADLDETFYWIVTTLDGRPTVTLRQRMTEPMGEGLVAADRTFYVSQGYNAMQALGAILPVEGGTLVFYRCHTSTDRAGGFASGSKHSIGRKVMGKQLEQIFERSRGTAK